MGTRITEEDWKTWITPAQASEKMIAALGGSGHKYAARHTILTALKNDYLQAAAERSSWANGGRNTTFEVVPANHWNNIDTDDLMWTTGVVTYRYHEYGHGPTAVSRFGMRFDPAGLDKLMPPVKPIRPTGPTWEDLSPRREKMVGAGAQQPQPTPSTPKAEVEKSKDKPEFQNRGGRPRKDFWEDLWVEMCRQIYADGLKHDRQSDIEDAMADWLTQNGYEAGEQSIRTRARKLIAMFRNEDKN